MNNTLSILEDSLNEWGALKPIKLGGERKAIVLSAENKQMFVDRLIKQDKLNNLLLFSIALLYFAIFGLALVLVYYYRTSSSTVLSILGGSVASLLPITWGLKSLWKEKSLLDILITVLPNMSPEEAVNLIKVYYFSKGEESGGSH